MGKGVLAGGKSLSSGGAFVVVVALNGPDDKPDMSTARSFLVTAAQGVSFDAGIWRKCFAWSLDVQLTSRSLFAHC